MAFSDVQAVDKEKQFLLLKAVKVDFRRTRPNCRIKVEIKVDDDIYEAPLFSRDEDIDWKKKIYITSLSSISITVFTVRKGRCWLPKSYAVFHVNLDGLQVTDGNTPEYTDSNPFVEIKMSFGQSMKFQRVMDLLKEDVKFALESKVAILDKVEGISDFAKKIVGITENAIRISAILLPLHQTAKGVVDIAVNVFKVLRKQQECHRAAVSLMETVNSRLFVADSIPKDLQRPELQKSLKALLEVMHEAFEFLLKFAQNSYDVLLSPQQMLDIAKLKEDIVDRTLVYHLHLDATTAAVVTDFVADTNKRAEDDKLETTLNKLNPVPNARFSQSDSCMEGTREGPLEQIMVWTAARTSPGLFWLRGGAGSGKSSIATSVRKELETKEDMAGAFFCKRDIPDQRNPRRVMPTLSFALAKMHKPYRDLLIPHLDKETGILTSPLSHQLKTLFLLPFTKIAKQGNRARPLVFIIDALDELECEDNKSRSEIADCLCRIAALADWLKVFVTSRPLHVLESEFSRPRNAPAITANSPAPTINAPALIVDLNSFPAESDIVKYTRASLKKLVDSHDLDESWLKDSSDVAGRLSAKASGLFIWISTVIQFISTHYDQDNALEQIMSGQDVSSLDSLYKTVIQNSRVPKEDKNKSLLKAVFGTIRITAKNQPLSVDGLYDLFIPLNGQRRVSKSTLRAIMNDLRSVLYEDTYKDGVIRVSHPSFLDYLEDPERCGEYWTDAEQLERAMTEKCLEIMQKELKFNICKLETSYLPNERVLDLKAKVREHISESLQYSCLFWTAYFTGAGNQTNDGIVTKFFNFENLYFLYWLEVLSLINRLKKGLDILYTLAERYEEQPDIYKRIREAYRFLTSFYHVISQSTPHLYTSALSWIPEETLLYQLIYSKFVNQPLVISGRFKDWDSALWKNATDSSISQVAFSPNGDHIAACFDDGSVRFWDANTGLTSKKLKSGDISAYTIAFSPNEREAASYSVLGLCIWDLSTGKIVGSPLTEFTSWINWSCYSPDGRFIASRSSQGQACIWDVNDRGVKVLNGPSGHGKIAYSPSGSKLACCNDDCITIHALESGAFANEIPRTGRVQCIIYSPNEKFLAFGGSDFSVRIWGGEPFAEVSALKGHTSEVTSVSFSPDSSELLSASEDATLIRWDMESFQMINTPFRAHEDSIQCAVYSPRDRHFIASGSEDRTVRFWDIRSITDAKPKSDKDAGVGGFNFIACSPLCTEFASLGTDGKVRIYDINSGTVLHVLSGYRQIREVAYSSDGRFLASSSSDNRIIIWDVKLETALRIFMGHTAQVASVIFAPNGKYVISASDDYTVMRWNIDSSGDNGKVLLTHSDMVYSVCFSPDGAMLASGGEDEIVRFSSPESGQEIGNRLLSEGTIWNLSFSVDGKLFAASTSRGLFQVWNVATGEELTRCIDAHSGVCCSVDFSQDGKHLLSTGSDGYIRIWGLETWDELRKLSGHRHSVTRAQYTNDGKRIISGSLDGTCRIWSLANVEKEGYVAEIDANLSSLPLIDGWIKSPKEDLLLWVPPDYRDGIRDMSEIRIPADNLEQPVKLRWSKLVKGNEWSTILNS